MASDDSIRQENMLAASAKFPPLRTEAPPSGSLESSLSLPTPSHQASSLKRNSPDEGGGAWAALLLVAAQDGPAAATTSSLPIPPAAKRRRAGTPPWVKAAAAQQHSGHETAKLAAEEQWGSSARRRQPHSGTPNWRHRTEKLRLQAPCQPQPSLAAPPTQPQQPQPQRQAPQQRQLTQQPLQQQAAALPLPQVRQQLRVPEVSVLNQPACTATIEVQETGHRQQLAARRPPSLPYQPIMPILTSQPAAEPEVVVRQLSPLERAAATVLPQSAAQLLAASIPEHAAAPLAQLLQQASPEQATATLSVLLQRAVQQQVQQQRRVQVLRALAAVAAAHQANGLAMPHHAAAATPSSPDQPVVTAIHNSNQPIVALAADTSHLSNADALLAHFN